MEWHLPNQLTLSRLGFAFLLFCCLYSAKNLEGATKVYVLNLAFVLFLVATITDFLDGYLARKWGLESDFGRLADPLIDKIIICGALIFLLSYPFFPLADWMVVAVISREFIVNGIRGYAESRGVKFGANWWGKLKMVLQSITVGWSFFYLANENLLTSLSLLPLFQRITEILIWLMLFATLYSGGVYIYQGWKIFTTSSSTSS